MSTGHTWTAHRYCHIGIVTFPSRKAGNLLLEMLWLTHQQLVNVYIHDEKQLQWILKKNKKKYWKHGLKKKRHRCVTAFKQSWPYTWAHLMEPIADPDFVARKPMTHDISTSTMQSPLVLHADVTIWDWGEVTITDLGCIETFGKVVRLEKLFVIVNLEYIDV